MQLTLPVHDAPELRHGRLGGVELGGAPAHHGRRRVVGLELDASEGVVAEVVHIMMLTRALRAERSTRDSVAA